MPSHTVYLPGDHDAVVQAVVGSDEDFDNVSQAVQHAVAETFGGADE